jgi:long-chain acyl-CoA synthetase
VRKPGTVGLPMPGTDIRVVDVETGTIELAPGQPGELCICGPQVMKGYWQRPDETAQVLRRGADGRVWLHTGDIATIDEDGYTTILQRKKDLIIVDGFNVYPSEVESVLMMHPAVRMSAAVGIDDAHHGEVVHAFVVLHQDAAAAGSELIAHCRAHLAPFKVPAAVHLRGDLPISAVGKVLYRVLRDQAIAGTTEIS